jgi:hypothetical protein
MGLGLSISFVLCFLFCVLLSFVRVDFFFAIRYQLCLFFLPLFGFCLLFELVFCVDFTYRTWHSLIVSYVASFI